MRDKSPLALQIYVKIHDKCVISPPLALQIYVKIRDNCVISPPLAFQNTCLIVANALTRQIYVFSRRKRVRRKRRPLSQFSDVVPPKGPNMRRHVHSLCGRNDDPCRNSEPSGSPRAQKSVDVHFPRQKPCKLSKSSIRSKHVFLRHPQDFRTFFSTFHVEKSEPCKNHVFSRQRIRRATWEH